MFVKFIFTSLLAVAPVCFFARRVKHVAFARLNSTVAPSPSAFKRSSSSASRRLSSSASWRRSPVASKRLSFSASERPSTSGPKRPSSSANKHPFRFKKEAEGWELTAAGQHVISVGALLAPCKGARRSSCRMELKTESHTCDLTLEDKVKPLSQAFSNCLNSYDIEKTGVAVPTRLRLSRCRERRRPQSANDGFEPSTCCNWAPEKHSIADVPSSSPMEARFPDAALGPIEKRCTTREGCAVPECAVRALTNTWRRTALVVDFSAFDCCTIGFTESGAFARARVRRAIFRQVELQARITFGDWPPTVKNKAVHKHRLWLARRFRSDGEGLLEAVAALADPFFSSDLSRHPRWTWAQGTSVEAGYALSRLQVEDNPFQAKFTGLQERVPVDELLSRCSASNECSIRLKNPILKCTATVDVATKVDCFVALTRCSARNRARVHNVDVSELLPAECMSASGCCVPLRDLDYDWHGSQGLQLKIKPDGIIDRYGAPGRIAVEVAWSGQGDQLHWLRAPEASINVQGANGHEARLGAQLMAQPGGFCRGIVDQGVGSGVDQHALDNDADNECSGVLSVPASMVTSEFKCSTISDGKLTFPCVARKWDRLETATALIAFDEVQMVVGSDKWPCTAQTREADCNYLTAVSKALRKDYVRDAAWGRTRGGVLLFELMLGVALPKEFGSLSLDYKMCTQRGLAQATRLLVALLVNSISGLVALAAGLAWLPAASIVKMLIRSIAGPYHVEAACLIEVSSFFPEYRDELQESSRYWSYPAARWMKKCQDAKNKLLRSVRSGSKAKHNASKHPAVTAVYGFSGVSVVAASVSRGLSSAGRSAVASVELGFTYLQALAINVGDVAISGVGLVLGIAELLAGIYQAIATYMWAKSQTFSNCASGFRASLGDQASVLVDAYDAARKELEPEVDAVESGNVLMREWLTCAAYKVRKDGNAHVLAQVAALHDELVFAHGNLTANLLELEGKLSYLRRVAIVFEESLRYQRRINVKAWRMKELRVFRAELFLNPSYFVLETLFPTKKFGDQVPVEADADLEARTVGQKPPRAVSAPVIGQGGMLEDGICVTTLEDNSLPDLIELIQGGIKKVRAVGETAGTSLRSLEPRLQTYSWTVASQLRTLMPDRAVQQEFSESILPENLPLSPMDV